MSKALLAKLGTYNFRSFIAHLDAIKAESKQLTKADKKALLRLRLKIVTSLLLGCTVIAFCLTFMLALIFVIIMDHESDKRGAGKSTPGKSQESSRADYLAFIDRHPEIYSRIRYRHGRIYALAKAFKDRFEEVEEIALSLNVYLRNNIAYLDDATPKQLFNFPDETLGDAQGTSQEISILAAALLYHMQIPCELIEADGHTFLYIPDASPKRYREAMADLLQDNFILLVRQLTVSKVLPARMALPERLIGPTVTLDIACGEPINIIARDRNDKMKMMCTKYKFKDASFNCRFDAGDKIGFEARGDKLVEVAVSISIDKESLLELIPDGGSTSGVYLDFTNRFIKGLSGRKPFKDKAVTKRYSVLPGVLCNIS